MQYVVRMVHDLASNNPNQHTGVFQEQNVKICIFKSLVKKKKKEFCLRHQISTSAMETYTVRGSCLCIASLRRKPDETFCDLQKCSYRGGLQTGPGKK